MVHVLICAAKECSNGIVDSGDRLRTLNTAYALSLAFPVEVVGQISESRPQLLNVVQVNTELRKGHRQTASQHLATHTHSIVHMYRKQVKTHIRTHTVLLYVLQYVHTFYAYFNTFHTYSMYCMCKNTHVKPLRCGRYTCFITTCAHIPTG